MEHTIYGLHHPRTGELRYIGVTNRTGRYRWSHHVHAAQTGSRLPVHCWIRRLLASGLKPTVCEIEKTPDRLREVFWIAHHRAAGTRLLNCTEGGEGNVNPTPETRLRMSRARLGIKLSPETRKKISEVQIGKKLSEEQKRKLSAALKGRPGKPHSPETRAKISAVQKGKKRGPRAPETTEKIRAALTGRKRSPEVCAKMSASKKGKPSNRTKPFSEAELHRLRTMNIGRKYGPIPEERRQKLQNCKRTTEQRARISAGRKGFRHSAEYVAKLRANPPQAKLTPADVRLIRLLHTTGKYLQRDLAQQFGVSRLTIGDLLRGTTWSHVT